MLSNSINRFLSYPGQRPKLKIITLLVVSLWIHNAYAQEDAAPPIDRPVSAIFESVWLIDNQTVDVPIKGTFEFDIMHRFGTLNNGYDDLFGFYSNSNIRMGLSYVPIENLSLGVGLTKFKHLVDANAKYSVLKQTRSGKIPLSITYYGNMVLDSRPKDNREQVYNTSDRYSFFHQVIIARKFSDWLSIQVAPNVSHYNIVNEGYDHNHFAVAVGAQVGLTESMDLIINVDQPVSKHAIDNPNPNVSFGIQIGTSSHAFQVFVGNSNSIVPQENNFFNSRNWSDNFSENFLLGFNITRLWSF